MKRTTGFTVDHKEFLESIPSEEELRFQLACNQRERTFLKRILAIYIEKNKLQPGGNKNEV